MERKYNDQNIDIFQRKKTVLKIHSPVKDPDVMAFL